MNLTNKQLKQFIKEEIEAVLLEENPAMAIGKLLEKGMSVDSIADAFEKGDALGTGLNIAALVNPYAAAAATSYGLKNKISGLANTYLKRKAAAKKKAEAARRRKAQQRIASGEDELVDFDTGELVSDIAARKQAQRMRPPTYRRIVPTKKARRQQAPAAPEKFDVSKFRKYKKK